MRMFTTTANANDTALEEALAEHPLHERDFNIPQTLTIDPTKKRQQIDGFGASITEATSFLWQNCVQDQEQFLTDLFSPTTGIGISMLRQPVGPSDHVTKPYRFLRRRPDKHLRSLNFEAEQKGIIPMVAAAQQVRTSYFNIIASPWSAPWWMKTNFSVLGKRKITRITGYLRKSCYQPYAEYLTKFVETYQENGLTVFAVTPTNEPDYPQSRWPSMAMKPAQQADFIANHLAPTLREHNLNTVNILCWDHNYSTDHYPDGAFVKDVYADQDAYNALAGSAWHYYGGSPQTMTKIHNAYPNKGIWVTEASGGDWGPRNWDSALLDIGARVIDMMNNWARSAVLWNVALDTDGGPDYYYLRNDRKHSQNRGLFTVDRNTGEYIKNTDYYVIGHFSKFVPIGSRWIQSSFTKVEGVRNVAFETPDHEIVLILANTTKEEKTFRLDIAADTYNLSDAGIVEEIAPSEVSEAAEALMVHNQLRDLVIHLKPRSLNTVVIDSGLR